MNWLDSLTAILFGNGSRTVNMDTSEDIYSADDHERWWQEVGMQEFLTMESEDANARATTTTDSSIKRQRLDKSQCSGS